MSIRRVDNKNGQAHQIQKELSDLRNAAQEANRTDSLSASMSSPTEASAAFEALSPVEQSAASLGVHPDAWRPISFMNLAHHEALIKANALDGDLARRIEAFRSVASSS